MSTKNIIDLLHMTSDQTKRDLLYEFKVLSFCFSNQVQRVVDDHESAFYKVLSCVDINKNGCAKTSFHNLTLIINVFEIVDEKQSENTFIVHVVSIDEELEQKLQQDDIKAFLESGVEID
ncbi:hypothetical protein [Shewanella polaris]|uniref:Uncharacterized protein n=1 Tax=Shewanella polaris TaxID=2588449 RepID=A0A4Y5YGM7_9GAMM|nr:hypothetical protein [Shewanella polaris]QDE31961.1 hypothetical protein FH971_13935 [Shewanella polaris]